MSFCFDSTTLIIDFTSLVYFIWKIIFWPARDSNLRPLGTIFSIKTSNRNLAFSAFPLLENNQSITNIKNILDLVDFEKRGEYILADVKSAAWFFECKKIVLNFFIVIDCLMVSWYLPVNWFWWTLYDLLIAYCKMFTVYYLFMVHGLW
jgi:hypothetical protein